MLQFRFRTRLGLQLGAAAAALVCLSPSGAHAQRVEENAVTSAEDAFGVSVGNERIGLYSDFDARGFSPIAAGNIRLEGLYIDNPTGFTSRLVSGSTLRVGIAAQGYPFPAPTGISDYALRRVGDEGVVSVIATVGPFGTQALAIDTQQPLLEGRLGFAGGVAYRHDEQFPGADYDTVAAAAEFHWQASERLLIQPFFAQFNSHGIRSAPLVFTDGASLPPPSPAENLSSDWVEGTLLRPMYGAVVSYQATDDWTIRAGLFHVENNFESVRTDLLRNAQPDGSVNRFVSASDGQTFGSTSGEVRATWTPWEGPGQHAFHFSMRNRDSDRTYGGGVVQALGLGNLYEDVSDLPEPAFAFGPQSVDQVRQTTLGVAYSGRWFGRGELRLGLQHANYEKTILAPGQPQIVSSDAPWLYDAALALNITRRLSAYASYTVGLEESSAAPENAVNRDEAPPALRTSQRDGGIRYRLSPNLTLVAGVFDVRKPYFNLDTTQLYRELGEVRHQGIELSLTGSPIEELSIVAGAVLLDGEVSGELVDLGLIGPRPVGQTERQLRLNADYRLPSLPALSVDLALLSTGERAASSAPQASLGDEQFIIPGRTTLDLGMRWRFAIGEASAVARLQVQNVTDNKDWDVGSNGAFIMSSPRRALFSITADF